MPLSQQGHVFIDPAECGSSVGYHMNVSEWENHKDKKTVYTLRATVVLTDCNRKIEWEFCDKGEEGSGYGGGLEKIDAAIAMLTQFRKKFADAKKHVEKLNG